MGPPRPGRLSTWYLPFWSLGWSGGEAPRSDEGQMMGTMEQLSQRGLWAQRDFGTWYNHGPKLLQEQLLWKNHWHDAVMS